MHDTWQERLCFCTSARGQRVCLSSALAPPGGCRGRKLQGEWEGGAAIYPPKLEIGAQEPVTDDEGSAICRLAEVDHGAGAEAMRSEQRFSILDVFTEALGEQFSGRRAVSGDRAHHWCARKCKRSTRTSVNDHPDLSVPKLLVGSKNSCRPG